MLTARLTLGLLTLFATCLATACTPSQPVSTEPEPDTDEAAQVEAPTAPEAASSGVVETAEMTTTRSGSFQSAEHETAGGVELVSQDGQQMLTFDESFITADGPDLVVVLHRSSNLLEESPPPAYPLNEEDYVVIAPLTATSGTQTYVVPAEIDLTAFASVAVWCQAFNATFGVATFQ
jgi:hypothetical protein